MMIRKDDISVNGDLDGQYDYESNYFYLNDTPWVIELFNNFVGHGNLKKIYHLTGYDYLDGKRLPVVAISDGEVKYRFLFDKKNDTFYPWNDNARSRYKDVMAHLSEKRSREEKQRERSRAMSSDRGLRLGLPSVDEVRRIAGSMPSYR